MSEADSEYEEVTFLLDFADLHPDAFQKLISTNPTCSILGVGGEQPVLQIGSSTFSGEYQDSTTTYVAFGEEPNREVIAQTEKMLVCSRVALEPKTGPDNIVSEPT
ncbi:hypothetical protein LOD99_12648 [Oopsacas minuta]|uniref:Transcription factor TFIIIC triple barrel domain-containing protein n=1 Tax=Oopsacas minuta TaxID=111878 RepID=A0AAV7JCN6_9METZ|nr:hypothetical protein LOD99_12648 [Oopsacas minuta]